MTDINKMMVSLPEIRPLNLKRIKGKIIYIGVVGFEDRSLELFNCALKAKVKFHKVVAIEYLPYDQRNRKEEFEKNIKRMRLANKNVHWLIYNRIDPESFSAALNKYVKKIELDFTIIVDISAMSKFLITVLLQELRFLSNAVEIAYSEAKLYHPRKAIFEKEKTKDPREVPIFLTTDIYKIVTTYSLSSISMQGYPIILITFLTFNYKELAALINEITPEFLVLIEGLPHRKKNEWRASAVRWINHKVTDYIKPEKKTVSTFDYKELPPYLETIYKKYGNTHKLIIAPTGSKLQTFAIFIFKQLHPDIQLIYPVTKEFSSDYTEKVEGLWNISIPEFNKFIAQLDMYRKTSLIKLKEKINLLEEKDI